MAAVTELQAATAPEAQGHLNLDVGHMFINFSLILHVVY